MTISLKVSVNGRYKATVKNLTTGETVEVHGKYDGSPNPSGEGSLPFTHGQPNTFELVEEYLGEAAPVVDAAAGTDTQAGAAQDPNKTE